LNAPDTLPDFPLNDWTAHQLGRVEDALSSWVAHPDHGPAPADLGEAMRYAVLDGGKRLRPLLVLATCDAVNGQADAALRAACAVELIHAYSLVHDDMPCMDNDVLRRGKPTVHVKYGQAQALLAGDALQALAFEMLTPETGDPADGVMQARLCRLLALAAGHQGMAGGQAIDLASVGRALTSEQLHEMHRLKTGALLETSVKMGAACGVVSADVERALAHYGAFIGLAFQVVDDILDVTADSTTLGKTAGKDAAQDKPTFVSLMGLDASKAYADALLARALQSLDSLHAAGFSNTAALRALATRLVDRTH
jgi:farnesyl diphosphate synthase